MLYAKYSSAKLERNDRMLQCPAAKNNKYSQQKLHLSFPCPVVSLLLLWLVLAILELALLISVYTCTSFARAVAAF